MKPLQTLLTFLFVMTLSGLQADLVQTPVADFPLKGRKPRLYCPEIFMTDCHVRIFGPFLSDDAKTVVFSTGDGFQINDKYFKGKLVTCAVGKEHSGAAVAFCRQTFLDMVATPFVKGGYCIYNCTASCISFPGDFAAAMAGGRGRRDREAPKICTRYIAFEDGSEMRVDSFDSFGVVSRDFVERGGLLYNVGKKQYLWFDGRAYGPYERFRGMYLSPAGRRLIFSYTEDDGDYVIAAGKRMGPFRDVLAVIINDAGDYGIHYHDGKHEGIILNGRDRGPLDTPRLLITGNPTRYSRDYYLQWAGAEFRESKRAKRYYRDENIGTGDLGRYHFNDLLRLGDEAFRIGYHYVRKGKRMAEIAGKTFGPFDSLTKAAWNVSGTKVLTVSGKEGSRYVQWGRKRFGPYPYVSDVFFTFRDEPAFVYLAPPGNNKKRSSSRESGEHVWHNGKILGPFKGYHLRISDDRRLFCHHSKIAQGGRVMVNGKVFGPYRYIPNIQEASPESFFFEYQTERDTFSVLCDRVLTERIYCLSNLRPYMYYNPSSGALAYLYENDSMIHLYLKGERYPLFPRSSWPDHPAFSRDLSVYTVSYLPKDRSGRYCWVNGKTAGPFPRNSRLLLGGGKRPFILYQKEDRLRIDELKLP